MPSAECIVAVSSTEWLNWLEHGELRCLGSRIRRVRSPEDAEGLSRVLDSAPYEKTFDEQALLLAVLKEDYLQMVDVCDSADGPDTFWLPVEAVREFLPISERGARLLEADAERARCAMGPPRYESPWQEWARRQTERRAHGRGIALVHALGLEGGLPLVALAREIPPSLDASALPGAERRERYSGTCAMAWAEALAIARHVAGEDTGSALSKNEDIRRFIGERATVFRLSDEDLFSDDAKRIAGLVESLLCGDTGVVFPFTAAVVVCHYRHVQERGQDFDPAVFGRNLAGLRDSYGLPYAALAAYLVGRCLGDTPVNSLWYATRSGNLPALKDQALPFDPRKLVPPPPAPPPDSIPAGVAGEPGAVGVTSGEMSEAGDTPDGTAPAAGSPADAQQDAASETSGAEAALWAACVTDIDSAESMQSTNDVPTAKDVQKPDQSDASPRPAEKIATGGKGKGKRKGKGKGRG